MVLKYEKIDATPAERVARWNLCQAIMHKLYQSTILTDDLEKIAVKASEENSKIKVSIS
jgi:hypothetical protein